MKILHICTYDSGGAGIAANRLHIGLKMIGLRSKMLVLQRSSSDKDVVKFRQHNSIFRRQWNKARERLISAEFDAYKDTRPKGLELFSDDRSEYTISKHPLIQEADIVHLHWIAGMIDYVEFFRNMYNKHIFWTLHDMNPFTGGCHYAGDCVKYKKMCCSCPQLGAKNLNGLSKNIWIRKNKSYKQQKLNVVTPSKWLANCANGSLLFKKFKVDIIQNGLSTTLFCKRDKRNARELFNLPQDKVIIMFGAQSCNNLRKGGEYLKEALMLLNKKVDMSNIAVAIFGDNQYKFLLNTFPFVYNLGIMRDELLLSICYSAADIFVIPSLEDNFPNTVLESMACETPVVGFKVGGIPEMIRPGKTGWLAEAQNSNELAEQIKRMIDNPEERKQMGVNARRFVEQECNLEIQAKRYYELYKSGFKEIKP